MYTSSKPYFYGTGRRKKSVARVRIVPGTGVITINGRDVDEYFGLDTLKLIVNQPFATTGTEGKFDIIARVNGGGFSGQAGAIRHGVARALLTADETYKPLVFPEAFYLATRGGGAFFGKVGSFEEGYEFDAVILDDSVLPHPQPLTLAERMERAVYLGLDEKNITAKFVAGEEILM